MTRDVTVLRSEVDEDRRRWVAAWRECGREPFAHPAYVDLFSGPLDRSRCLVVRSSNGAAMLPFILRPIPHHVPSLPPGLHDATSPYGYGGPFYSVDPRSIDVWSPLANWLHEENIVSFFGRLSLTSTPEGELPAGATLRSAGENIVVDLTRSPEQQWSHYEHKVRKNVKKARAAGLSATIKPEFSDLDEFLSVYHGTMDRRGASSFYDFDRQFFDRLFSGIPGGCLAVEVRDADGVLVSAEVILTSDRFIYSYLGGTRLESYSLRPNDLLKHEVVAHGHESQRSGYVLGGGYAPGDGIFRYKRSFDPTGSVPFLTFRLISHDAAYDALVEARRGDSEPGEGAYFPFYRRPATRREQLREDTDGEDQRGSDPACAPGRALT